MAGKELLRLTVNGDVHELAASPNETLLEVLREGLGLVATKRGCDDGSCGACTVLIDGEPALSCLTLALLADGAEVTTADGRGHDELARALEESLASLGGLQCGYCTPAIVLVARSFLKERPDAGEEAVRAAISGNLCRCTGYASIVAAVEKVAAERRERHAGSGAP